MLSWFSQHFLSSDENPHGFRGKHLGPLHWFLGIAVDQHGDYAVSANQTKYIEKMLDKFFPSHKVNGISHTYPCNPDTFHRIGSATNDEERATASRLPYMQLIGSLLYVSVMTRPDIAHYMSILCKFMSDPSPIHHASFGWSGC